MNKEQVYRRRQNKQMSNLPQQSSKGQLIVFLQLKGQLDLPLLLLLFDLYCKALISLLSLLPTLLLLTARDAFLLKQLSVNSSLAFLSGYMASTPRNLALEWFLSPIGLFYSSSLTPLSSMPSSLILLFDYLIFIILYSFFDYLSYLILFYSVVSVFSLKLAFDSYFLGVV